MPRPEHLSMIQAIITRLAGNSFLIKGWSITLTAALLGFAAKDQDPTFAWIAFGAAATFAFLDARYLALERKYIALYQTSIAQGAQESWSLEADDPNVLDIVGALFGWSVASVHGVTMIAALAVAVLG